MRERPQSFPSVALARLIQKGRKITYGIVQPGEFVADGVILVRGRDYSAGWRDIDGFMRVTPEIDAPYKRSKLKPGDLVLTIVGANTGTVAVVPAWLDGANITQTTARIAVDATKAIPGYVEQVLRSAIGQEAVYRFQKGGAQPGLNLADVEKFEIPLPPLPEQRKIAEILRTWDEALEKLTALRAAKLKRHRGLTTALVFGAKQLDRFRRTDQVAPYRWFQLPTSWSCQHIGDLATEVSERNGAGEQHEVLSCSKHDGFVRSLEYFKKQVFSSDLSGYKKIWRGDFGFPSNHVEEGSIGLQNLTDIGVVSPIYTIFRFDADEVNKDYAFAVLKTELYRHIFEVSTSASVDRRGSLRWREFSRIPFPIPPLDEQEAIAEVLRASQSELDGLSEEIEALIRQKRGLMQKLLTGEWRVNSEKVLA
ncbi:restriction endonuclease subunit S [Tropicibacter sp. R15_0]|uniref:restriction endonuclease subunit S n=1 Tax=Tropicibacter sp. R15_0 TaxID=2821101 RepID=UPI001ADAE6FD|nr:restriction endonuclease subunit S [Tropicibacter sp. R15_0]MBO9463951.1 restriction endonuclease subunit S [Tropicibacter sp. R15_0]